MKQKILIQVPMHCDKCRTKALTIAADAEGVTSVALHGDRKDKLLVVGDDVDAATLTRILRKKLCYATLETVEEVKPEKKKEEEKKPCCPIVCYHQPELEILRVVPDPYHSPSCAIL